MSTSNTSNSSNELSICLTRLSETEKAYVDANKAWLRIKNKRSADDREFDRRAEGETEQLVKTLGTICDVSRYASEPGRLVPDDLKRVVERAAMIENTVIQLSFDAEGDGSYVGCGNVIKEEGIGSMGGHMGTEAAKDLLRIMLPMFSSGESGKEQEYKTKMLGYALTPHKDTPKPSPYTTPLARFCMNPVMPGPDASATTIALAEARCEIQSDEIPRPATLCLAGDTLALIGAGGWKEQAGVMTIYDLSTGNGSDFYYSEKTYGLGRSGGSETAVDELRGLIYVGGDKGTSAYRYKKGSEDVEMEGRKSDRVDQDAAEDANSDSEEEDDDDDDDFIIGAKDPREDLVFSLPGKGYNGALALTADRTKVLRTGRKGLGVWDVSSRSTGGTENFISLDSEAFSGVETWAKHPSQSQERLVASGNQSYFVSSVSVETGEVVSRYVGHNTAVNSFSTGKHDPHSFLTANPDGVVRFYDSRLPAPVYAIQHASGDDIQSVLYENIGGHPFIIIGGSKSQQIKIWDARGRTPLYQLSTGNNAVQAMVWDDSRNHLFAATDCESRGYHGTAFDYREADFGDEDEDYGDMAWPSKAYHDETSFGYPFDCGSHRLLRYRFMSEPDTKVLPAYGDAQPDRGGGGYGMFGF